MAVPLLVSSSSSVTATAAAAAVKSKLPLLFMSRRNFASFSTTRSSSKNSGTTTSVIAAAAAAATSTAGFMMMWMISKEAEKDQERPLMVPKPSSKATRTTTSPMILDHLPVFSLSPFGWVGKISSTSLCDAGGRASSLDRNDVTSFPDLSRFGQHSYLKRYLTPTVYEELSTLKTTNGVTLEDLIKSGVALPYGARPPRGLGVYAGDTESYRVFASLLTPIIEDYHHYRHIQKTATSTTTASGTGTVGGDGPGIYGSDETNESSSHGRRRRKRKSMLRRQFTNLNPSYVLRQQLDPSGDYILQTRMRVARSIDGFTFSPVMTRQDRRKLERLFVDCITNSQEWTTDDELNGQYLKVMEMSNDEHDRLIEQHILFHDPDEYNISAGIGRDWPDARGIFINRRSPSTSMSSSSSTTTSASNTTTTASNSNTQPDLMIWVNKEDHLRIIATANGGDLLGVFKRLTKALSVLEKALQERGHAWCTHPQYGFVNTSPENLGTALRASVFVKLYRLGKQPGFEELLDRLRLESSSRFRGSHDESLSSTGLNAGSSTTSTAASAAASPPPSTSGRYTGIFDIANAERLGQSEVQLINTMINGVGRLIELEKRLERGEKINLNDIRE